MIDVAYYIQRKARRIKTYYIGGKQHTTKKALYWLVGDSHGADLRGFNWLNRIPPYLELRMWGTEEERWDVAVENDSVILYQVADGVPASEAITTALLYARML